MQFVPLFIVLIPQNFRKVHSHKLQDYIASWLVEATTEN